MLSVCNRSCGNYLVQHVMAGYIAAHTKSNEVHAFHVGGRYKVNYGFICQLRSVWRGANRYLQSLYLE